VTAVATEIAAPGESRPATSSSSRLFEPSEVTLEESILGAWEALEARGRAGCPVCRGELEAGGCATCGSQLT
jgi:hypothetical protein